MEEFSRLRAIFFPIRTCEMKKFFSLACMMFFVLFNYTLLRDTKDALVVNAAGAEALGLLKLCGTVPGAIVILLIYSKLSSKFSRETVFYIIIVPFLIFFALFAYTIYPNRHLLHPSQETVEALSLAWPRLKTVFAVWGSWSYGIFYVLSELWGSVVLSLLFWQFANEIVRFEEAGRFYTMFGLIANLSGVVSGLFVRYFSAVRENLPAGVDPWGYSLYYLMGSTSVAGLALIGIYRWINLEILPDPQYYTPKEKAQEKLKMSIRESFNYLIRSKHLGFVALLVICYGISINTIECVWKDQIRRATGNANNYDAFMGGISIATGLSSLMFYILGSNIVRIFGWKVSARFTPCMMLLTGIPFFLFVIFRNWLPLTVSPVLLAVWIGSVQNVMTKASKYALFDPTKEMCYIPLGAEERVKGKAAVDVVASRLGKSGGAFLQQFFLFLTGSTLVGIAPLLAIGMLGAVAVWLFATSALGKSLGQYEEAKKEVLVTA